MFLELIDFFAVKFTKPPTLSVYCFLNFPFLNYGTPSLVFLAASALSGISFFLFSFLLDSLVDFGLFLRPNFFEFLIYFINFLSICCFFVQLRLNFMWAIDGVQFFVIFLFAWIFYFNRWLRVVVICCF